jgi:murein endopeptidase
MNGGPFTPHGSHTCGIDVDGYFTGYEKLDAAAATTIIGHLNATNGSQIKKVFVAYTANDAFGKAIQGVTLKDGRAATSVIRPDADHTGHFHWRVKLDACP